MSKFSNFLIKSCNLNTPIFLKENDFQLRDLRGPQKIKLFEGLKKHEMFPQFENGQNVQNLWEEFYKIYNVCTYII